MQWKVTNGEFIDLVKVGSKTFIYAWFRSDLSKIEDDLSKTE